MGQWPKNAVYWPFVVVQAMQRFLNLPAISRRHLGFRRQHARRLRGCGCHGRRSRLTAEAQRAQLQSGSGLLPGAAAVAAGGVAGGAQRARLRSGHGAVVIAAGGVAGGAAEGATVVGAGAGAGADGPAVVDAGAGGVDDGVGAVNDGAVGLADTFVSGGADRLLKRESSWLATSNRPSARTATDTATQPVFDFHGLIRPDKVVRQYLEHDEVEAE